MKMGLWENVKSFFSTNSETKENHVNETLRTHYYKSTKEKVMKEIEAMLNQKTGFTVASVNEDHGEIIVHVKKGKKAFVVITVIMVKPFRTAVDVSVSTDTFLFTDFGSSRKMIIELYEEMNKRMEFVGTGLGEKLTNSW